MTEAVRRRIATAVPCVVSLGLSLATVGGTVHWQDSGFYLSAVREMAVLYPPGFVLYLILAKLWTYLLFFVDFTVAVHLFSSACAAAAASVLARAVAALLRSRGRLFGLGGADPGGRADWAGACVGVLAASGYTFWAAGIMAKGYALYYLVLSLLLLRMIRADEGRKPADFTVVAVLIGLAWQAHPSAALAGLGLLVFLAVHGRSVGWGGVAWRTALAAACAAGPVLLLPWIASGDAASSFGDPRTASDLLEYFTGRRFVGRENSFGWEPSRLTSMVVYGWEEFGVVGGALVTAGLIAAWRRNRRLLGWALAWAIPVLEVTVLFLIEGQHDYWFVAAWLPFWLLAGVGLDGIAARIPWPRPALVATGIAAAGLTAAVASNARDVNLRGYDLAERHARAHVESIEDDAILLVLGDDAAAGVHYLQEVRGEKRGVTLIRAGHLERGRSGEPSWYDRKLLRIDPALARPDYAAARARHGGDEGVGVSVSAFLESNAGRGRAVYLAFGMPPEWLPEGYCLSPAGAHWKLTRGPEDPDPRHWSFASGAEQMAGRYRRPRGQRNAQIDHVDRLVPEPYERRLLQLMLEARRKLADWNHDHGGWREAATLYDSIVDLDPDAAGDPLLSFRRGECLLMAGQGDRGGTLLSRALSLGVGPAERAAAHAHLARICRERGDEPGVRSHLQAAAAVRSPPDEVQERLARLRGAR